MKRIIVFLLFIVFFINFNSSAFASQRKGDVSNGMRKGFGFLVKTRDESVLKPETIQKRRNMESLIIRTYREGDRALLLQIYNEQVEGFNNEIRNDKEGRVYLYQDCLRELRRIRNLMVSSSK